MADKDNKSKLTYHVWDKDNNEYDIPDEVVQQRGMDNFAKDFEGGYITMFDDKKQKVDVPIEDVGEYRKQGYIWYDTSGNATPINEIGKKTSSTSEKKQTQYPQEVIDAYNSPANKPGNFKDLSQLNDEYQRGELKKPGLISQALGMIPKVGAGNIGREEKIANVFSSMFGGGKQPQPSSQQQESQPIQQNAPTVEQAHPIAAKKVDGMTGAAPVQQVDAIYNKYVGKSDALSETMYDLMASGQAQNQEEAQQMAMGAMNRAAYNLAQRTTDEFVNKLGDTVADIEQAIDNGWYQHDVQDKLKNMASKLGIMNNVAVDENGNYITQTDGYDQFINGMVKPAMMESLVKKYGENYREQAEKLATRLYSHDEHVQDRLMNQDINDALSDVISKYTSTSVAKAIQDAEAASNAQMAKYNEQSKYVDAASPFAIGAIEEANKTRDPQKILGDLQKKFGKLYQNPQFLNDMSNAAFKVMQRYGLNGTLSGDPKQFKPMINAAIKSELDQLEVKGMIPKGSADYILKTGIENTIIGKVSRKIMQTDYQNWLEDIANQQYQPGFWERVGSGALTFAGDAWSYWLPGAAGGKVTKSMLAKAEGKLASDLMAKGMEAKMAERAAKVLIGKSKGMVLKTGAAHGAVTFGGQSAISKPIDEVYRTGQFDENGNIYNPSVAKILANTLEEVTKQGAVGAIMQGGTIANMVGKGRGLATNILADVGGKAVDSSIMTGQQMLERMAQDPNFKPTGKDAAESFLESMTNLTAIGLPGIMGKYARFKNAKEFNRKYDFNNEDMEDLKRLGYSDLRDAFEKMAIDGYQTDGVDFRMMQQLNPKYMDFMNNKSVPETLKAKMMAVVEGKRPSSFSPVIDSLVVQPMDRGGKVYLETFNKDGGVIERKEYSSLDEAQKAEKKLEHEKMLGIASVLEGEFHNEFTQEHLDGLYNQAAQKYNMGEKLTDEEKAAVYLRQNAAAINEIMKKQQSGMLLTEQEQQQVSSYRHFYESALENSSVMREFVNTFEDSHGVARGTLRKALDSNDKKYAPLVESYVKELYNAVTLKREMRQTVDDLYNTAHGRDQERLEQSVTEGGETPVDVTPSPSAEATAPSNESQNVPTASSDVPPTPPVDGDTPSVVSDANPTDANVSSNDGKSDVYVMGQNAYKNGDTDALQAINHNDDVAKARLKRAFANDETKINLVVKSYEDGKDMEQFVAQRANYMTPLQKEAVRKYVEAQEAKKGALDALDHADDGYADTLMQQLWPYQTEDGSIVPATLTTGQQVFLKKANEYGGGFVVVPDENGNPTIKQVSSADIKEVGTPIAIDDFINQKVTEQQDARYKQFRSQFDGSGFKRGDIVSVSMEEGDEPFDVKIVGYTDDGHIILTDVDVDVDSQIDPKKLEIVTKDEFNTWRHNALDASIGAELDAEDAQRANDDAAKAEAAKKERYKKGIFGYAAGQPDYSDPMTDYKVAAEYLQESVGNDRKALFGNIAAEKKSLQTRINQLREHIAKNEEWLSINADLDPKNAESRTLANKQMDGQIADLQARFDKWNKIRSAVMTPEEATAIKEDRAKKITDVGVNEADIVPIEGREIAVLTDEELKKQYPTMDEASDYITSERKRIYKIQSDEVQREIDGVDDVLNRYVNGEIDLEPEQIKELNTTKAQMVARQANLTESAKELKTQADKLKTLYRKENMEERAKIMAAMTPAEQRAVNVEKAIKKGNLSQLNTIYEEVRGATDFTDIEPNTLEEYVASNIGRYFLNYEGKEKGGAFSNGIQQETGLDRKDFNKLQILAKEGEGETVAEFVHGLYNDMPENLRQMGYKDQDIRNSLLNLIENTESYSDLKNYTLNNKVYDAEQKMRALEDQEEAMRDAEGYTSERVDNQGNPINEDGSLKLEPIKSVDDLTDDDFLHPFRNVKLPTIPKKIDEAIGANGKPVIIKKNIFERNSVRHGDLTPEQSRQLFSSALYRTDLYGQTQKKKRPYNWVVINTKDEKGKNRTVLLEINPQKDNVEVVHWHFVDEKGLKKLKRQAEREDGQLLILPSDTEEVGALSDPTINLSSDGKDTNNSDNLQGKGEKFSERLRNAIAETVTEPTEAQKKAGNYKKGHLSFGGYDFTVETPKGATRSGKDENGKPWSVTMHDTYGYILGKIGVDGDHIDMFINDAADLDTFDGNVYVVDQVDPNTGEFDEHKVMYGYPSEEAATKAYLANYSKGWKGLGKVTGVPKATFDKWLETSNRKTKPFADYAMIKEDDNLPFEAQTNLDELPFDRSVKEVKPKDMTEAQQIAYKAVSTMLKKAGIPVKVVSNKDMERVAEEHDKLVSGGGISLMRTYHGSQASFDHFDHSFMGSGEGAQAYGWGTYVSEVEGIAKSYAKQNAAKHGMPREYKIAQTRLDHAKFEYDKVQRAYDNSKAYIDSLKEDLQNYRESIARRKEKVAYFAQNNMPETVDKLLKLIKRTEDTIKVTEDDINMRTNDLEGWKPKLEEVKKKYKEEQKKFDAIPKPQIERNLYSVDIPDDTGDNYLGWDEPLTEKQIEMWKNALLSATPKKDREEMEKWANDLIERRKNEGEPLTGQEAYYHIDGSNSSKKASMALAKAGFDGVKVIAQRNTGGNKENKMNYVIFDENKAKIIDHTKFAKGKGTVYGYTDGHEIVLNQEHLNPNTPIHEYQHIWRTAAKAKNPDLIAHGDKLIKETEWFKNLQNDPNYKHLNDEQLCDEAFARLTGDEGEAILEQMAKDAIKENPLDTAKELSIINRLKKWLKQFWYWTLETFTKWKPEDIKKMTLEDIRNLVLRDLAQGVDPRAVLKEHEGNEKEELKIANGKFNSRLDELVKNPNQKDKVLRLGRSSSFLKDGGIADAEIELEFDKFVRKSGDKYKNNHPFEASDLKNLPMAIAEPIAVFNSTNANDHVVLTELQKDGKNFIVAIRAVEQHRKGGVVLEVNQITSLYPKEEKGIVNWINTGRISNVDKEKALHFIEALQPHAGTTITDEELNTAANVINSFETSKENGEKFSLKDEKTMFGMHNISLDKLRKAIKQGGFAAPSMGVIDSKNGIYSDYGSITLIPKAEKLAKSKGKNAGTFTADAWTPVYPHVEKIMTKQGEKAFKADMNKLYDNVEVNIWSNIKDSWKAYFSNGDVRDGLYFQYLQERGMKPEVVYQKGKYDKSVFDKVKSIVGNFNKVDFSDSEVSDLIKLMNEVTGKDNSVEGQRKSLEAKKEDAEKKDNKLLIGLLNRRLASLDDMEDFYVAYDFMREVAKDHSRNGDVKVFDSIIAAKQKVVENKKMDSDFNTWLDEKSKQYDAQEMLYNGTTPTGKPKYIPNTIDNAVKLMKKQGLAGGYNVFHPGVGAFIAKLSPQVNTLSAMKKAKNKLIPFGDERHDEVRDKIIKEHRELARDLQIGESAFDDSGEDRMQELAELKPSDLKDYIKRHWDKEVSDDWVERYNDLVNTIKNDYPVYYFETKFMRPYGLDEFDKAIVPKDTPKDVVDALKKAGIDVHTYDGKEDREKVTMDAINNSEGIRFMFAGEKGAAEADKTEEQTIRMDNLDVAKQMEEAKKDAKAIKMATGWEKGVDGKWRYEMPDAKIKDTIDVGGGNIVKRFEEDMLWTDSKLEDAVDAPKLFEAYPQLKNIKIHTDAVMNGMPSNGEYDYNTRTITIHADELKYLNSILNHEIQHAIQHIEGFATGGNTEQIEREFNAAKAEQKARNYAFELEEKAKEMGGEYNQSEVEKALVKDYEDLGMSDDLPDKETRIKGFNYFARGYADRSMDDAIKRFRLNESTRSDFNSYLEYQKLAGEVEARNVQKRMGMSDEERRNSLASETEDVDRGDQIVMDGDGASYSIVKDPETIKKLDKEDTVKVYRAMQVGEDGKLYPPMAAKVKGKFVQPIELGKWEQADERPDLADDKGMFTLNKGNGKSLKAAYNPYLHTSRTPLNDQFSEAQNRPNIVTVEVEVPKSELTSGYKAYKAKDAVGEVEWKAGIIQGQLTGKRKVILSRWDKPVRIVPDSEVADVIVNNMFKDKNIIIPTNVVTPSLRKELEKRGVPFVETDNRGRIVGGENDGVHYSKVYGKNAQSPIMEEKLKNHPDSLIKTGTYFSGGGLVEEGLKGIIDPVVAVEYDKKISGVYRNNFGQHIVTADVRDVDPKDLVKQIDGDVEYFHASPVCKNYSQAKANGTEVELDKETAKSTADFINAVKPRVVTIENVKGYRDSEAMKIITNVLDKNGYKWDADVYNAADYGGYTNRERLIVRAVKNGKLPAKPKKQPHKGGWLEAVEDIIPTLSEKTNGVAPWMDARLKADGIDWENVKKPLYVMGSAYANGKIPHAYGDEILPTLRTKSGDVIIMPGGKVLRADGRVLARVSGMDDDYKLPAAESLAHTIIGNGIPTQLTKAVIAPLLNKDNLSGRNILARLGKSLYKNHWNEEEQRKVADNVVNTANQLGGASATVYTSLDEVPDAYLSDVKNGATGWYDPSTHTVHVYLPNCADADEAQRTVFHEKIGHEGMEVLLDGEQGVRKFANFVYQSVGKKMRGKILDFANKYDPDWQNPDRINVGTQEYIAHLAEEGPRTAEDFSIWTKIKHYLIKVLKKLGIRIPGLLNDKDLRYYLMKAGKALHVWDNMPKEKQEAMMAQASNAEIKDALSDEASKGKSAIQYMKRVMEWKRWKNAREDKDDPEPPMFYDFDKDAEGKKEWEKLNKDWRDAHGLKGDEMPIKPERKEGETDEDFFPRYKEWEKWKNAIVDKDNPMPDMFSFEKQKQDKARKEYEAWLTRHELNEQNNADLDLYEGKIYTEQDLMNGRLLHPAETNPDAAVLDQKAMQDLAEVTSSDVSKEGAARSVHDAVIYRRKNIESASATDAIFINSVKQELNKMANASYLGRKADAIADVAKETVTGKSPKTQAKKMAEAIPYIIEAPRRMRDIANELNAVGAFENGHIHVTAEDVDAIQPFTEDLRELAVKSHKVEKNGKETLVYDDVHSMTEVASKMAKAINDNHKGEEGFAPVDGTDVLAEHVLPVVLKRIVPKGIEYKNLSEEMQSLLGKIRDWYDKTFTWLKDSHTVRDDIGYTADYVNHRWDKEKSDDKAYADLVEGRQRTKSPNEKPRKVSTYMEGIDAGLVPKTTDITDLLSYYSQSNIEAFANKTFLQELSGINVIERNKNGEIISSMPLLSSVQPKELMVDETKYTPYVVPGINTVWVYNQGKIFNKSAEDWFNAAFGTVKIPKVLKGVKNAMSIAKTLELGFSGFHAGALTEVYAVQNSAEFGPAKAMAYFMKYLITDTAKTHQLPAFANPEAFKEAAKHLVKFGSASDYATADIENLYGKVHSYVAKLHSKLVEGNVAMKAGSSITFPLEVATELLKMSQKGLDVALWSYLHDGLKLATYQLRAERTMERAKKLDWDEEILNKALDEDGQFVNDMFGGQHFDVLGISKKMQTILDFIFLSKDWLISTTRHALSIFGYGSIWNEASIKNFWEYYKHVLGRGEMTKEDYLRLSRSKSGLLCYGVGFLIGYEGLSQLVNAAMRAWDEEKQKEKAEEIRKTNPSYKSPYELAYPDGMKWYDYLMRGNSLGQQSKIFMGRYADGTEMYIRHGKQFREIPELFFDAKDNFAIPGPMVRRMYGKASPLLRGIMDAYKWYLSPNYADKEMQRKYGEDFGLIPKLASYYVPFAVPTQKDKEFKMLDLVFPSSKGFSRYKAQDYFKTFIMSEDKQGLAMTYNACVQNGVDPEEQLKAAISSVKALEASEMQDGVTSLQIASKRFDEAKSITEKKKMRQKMKKFLSQSEYKAFTQKEALDMVQSYLNGEDDLKELQKADSKYLMKAKSEDVTEDWRIQNVWNGTMDAYQEYQRLKDVDIAKANAFKNSKTNKRLFAARKAISAAKKKMNKAKKQMDGQNDAAKMVEIRKIRKELLETLNGME